MPLDQTGRALCTDLYELTMAAAYWQLGMDQRAAFELFVRSMPPHRGYLVCAGLEQALDYLEALRFTPEQIDYLRGLPVFADCPAGFFDYLADLRFTGDVDAVAEGTMVFAGEPLLRVEAPIIEAQMVETFLLTMLNFQSMVSTKSARVSLAARSDGRDRTTVDFGSRRAHGPDAAVLAARAAFIGGCVATSNVEAGHRFGIPVSGTEAHSFIMAFGDEAQAFSAYYDCFGVQSVLLVDTYDSVEGARKAARAAPRLRGVRIDSGDLAQQSRRVRQVLDEEGLSDAMVLLSGDLDEYEIERLIAAGAQADGFGVGTRLVTSNDAPYLGGVYKLVAMHDGGAWTPRMKLSPDKATYPGRKQVYRLSDHDVVATVGEPPPADADALLQPVMRDGRAIGPRPALPEIQGRAAAELARLAPEHRRLRDPAPYPVRISAALEADFARLAEELKRESPWQRS